MGPLQTLTAILGLSTVSGVNLYLTVLLVGLGQRFGWIHGLPQDLAILSHPIALGVAGVLFLLEFVADKVPFVTPIWDGLHTFIRPVGGALLALGAAAELHPLAKVLAMLAGGSIALGTHGGKMGVRILAHTSPEPASHSLLSLAEDLGVVGLLALAYHHPAIALPVLGGVLLATALLLPLLLRTVVVVLAGFRGALRALFHTAGRDELPAWVELKVLELAPGGASTAVPCFARRVKGVPRLRAACLVCVGGDWHLIYRRWFRTQNLPLDQGPLRYFSGILWTTVVVMLKGKPQLLLVTREWRSAISDVIPVTKPPA